MTIDTKKLREHCNGFRGRFFFDHERGDLAFVAKDCDDKRCSCERKVNADGDQDCSVCIGDMDHGADTGVPLADMLNAAPALLDEIERLRESTCERHAGQAHGAEAEELRSGIERLLTSVERAAGHDARLVLSDLRRDLRRLVDRVDARDSLAYLEARDEKLATANAEIERPERLCAASADSYVALAVKLHTLAGEYAGPRPINSTPDDDLAALEDAVAGAESERDEHRREKINAQGQAIALQAQLDAVAEALGDDRVAESDGFLDHAVRGLIAENERLRNAAPAKAAPASRGCQRDDCVGFCYWCTPNLGGAR